MGLLELLRTLHTPYCICNLQPLLLLVSSAPVSVQTSKRASVCICIGPAPNFQLHTYITTYMYTSDRIINQSTNNLILQQKEDCLLTDCFNRPPGARALPPFPMAFLLWIWRHGFRPNVSYMDSRHEKTYSWLKFLKGIVWGELICSVAISVGSRDT